MPGSVASGAGRSFCWIVRAIAISPSSLSFSAVCTISPSIEPAMPSKERARSPIWSRDRDCTRTEKSPRAMARLARVSRLTFRAMEPTRMKAMARATR